MHRGKERDAVFILEDTIHAYEFTVSGSSSKARQDARKLGELLNDLGKMSENSFKTKTGWFITRNEPTADQRRTVSEESRKAQVTIHPASINTLQRRICDSTAYLRARDEAPFGSISYLRDTARLNIKVDVSFSDEAEDSIGIRKFASKLREGYRSLILGEFGVGKSHALRELYHELRKRHLKDSSLTPFPVHINLRDCAGLRSPAEILRRHSEEIGFASERSLISAWRAGACILLLDGFDEIVPTRWLGNAADLKEVRRAALEPVRRLVEETPDGTGVAICGRSHYFSSEVEMIETLGFESSDNLTFIQDFTQQQVDEYLKAAGVTWNVPDWLPARPLLIGYLVAIEALADLNATSSSNQAAAWRKFFNAICEREAKMFSAVRPDTIRRILSRVATLARSKGDETGPIDMDMMKDAFITINNRQPDGEGLQLLLRLPGLAMSGDENRVFVDRNLADTAYGEDLAFYISNPYDEHPLSKVSSWFSAASELGIEVAAKGLEDNNITSRAALSVATRRQNANRFDAVLSDMLSSVSALEPETVETGTTFLIEGVIYELLSVNSDDPLSGRISYQDCIIQTLDISMTERGQDFPAFHRCLIGFLDGATSIPSWLDGNFIDCDIEQYSVQSHTTAGILQLNMDPELKVALTILKKIYYQRGSGRKEGALSRGLDQASKDLVPAVIVRLQSAGWIIRSSTRSDVVYRPVKNRYTAALRALEKPGEFRILSTLS
ncbi:hypothetical protein GCM10028833_04890 [Glycomyces tarimensis]